MNRRKFATTLSAAALAVHPMANLAIQLPMNPELLGSAGPLESHAVYDVRLDMSDVALKEYFGDASTLHTYKGDLSAIWYRSLERLLTVKHIRILGITRHTEFFILRTLARELDAKVIHAREFAEHAVWHIEPN